MSGEFTTREFAVPFAVYCSPFTQYSMRSVLFVDPPAFCTTLEGLVAPTLSSRPVAIAPPAADRATLLALSDEARRAGLHAGMPVRQARACADEHFPQRGGMLGHAQAASRCGPALCFAA